MKRTGSDGQIVFYNNQSSVTKRLNKESTTTFDLIYIPFVFQHVMHIAYIAYLCMAGMDKNRHTCPNPVSNLLHVIGKTQKKIHENKECFFFYQQHSGK